VPTLFDVPNPPPQQTSTRRILKRVQATDDLTSVPVVKKPQSDKHCDPVRHDHSYNNEESLNTPTEDHTRIISRCDHSYADMPQASTSSCHASSPNDFAVLSSSVALPPEQQQQDNTRLETRHDSMQQPLTSTPEKRLTIQLAAERLKTRRQAMQITSLQSKLATQNASMQKLFKADQIEHLNGNSTFPWCSDSQKWSTNACCNGQEWLRISA
jgi:hypothetical protein